jgi:hypothetical protein
VHGLLSLKFLPSRSRTDIPTPHPHSHTPTHRYSCLSPDSRRTFVFIFASDPRVRSLPSFHLRLHLTTATTCLQGISISTQIFELNYSSPLLSQLSLPPLNTASWAAPSRQRTRRPKPVGRTCHRGTRHTARPVSGSRQLRFTHLDRCHFWYPADTHQATRRSTSSSSATARTSEMRSRCCSWERASRASRRCSSRCG